jgi:putative flippase GtrA
VSSASSNRAHFARFLVVGTTTVAIDLAVYSLLLPLGVAFASAKGIGFVAGTLFAYFANRLWTFNVTGGPGRMARFVVVYGVNLGVNVGLNSFILGLLGYEQIDIVLAFLVATGTSAILNFLGMKFLVFKA